MVFQGLGASKSNAACTKHPLSPDGEPEQLFGPHLGIPPWDPLGAPGEENDFDFKYPPRKSVFIVVAAVVVVFFCFVVFVAAATLAVAVAAFV